MSKEASNHLRWPIIGHSNIVTYLQNSLANKNLAHAYLFVGPDHLGKATVAKLFTHALVCHNFDQHKGSLPCGECPGCRQAIQEIHPDIYWLKREINEKTGKLKKNISIEQIRELQSKLNLRSFLNSYKVAVISDAQTLSLEAANALLKGLEEPSAKTVLILLSNTSSRLPKTIVSRCQVIKFRPVSDKEIIDYLTSIKVERKKAKTLTAVSFGLPGLALRYYEDHDGYLDFQETVRMFLALINQDISSRFKFISELVSNDVDETKEVLLTWRKILRDVLLIKNSVPNLISNGLVANDLERLAARFEAGDITAMINEIDLAKRYLDSNVGPKLTLENLVLKF
ncbi:MAG: DNA polymerase III subunit delta' [Candidatus Buchananbacteria bacterium]|nr:DNA polymerase III subunit delta' [Candidatus Buchananbacteria bacterium]